MASADRAAEKAMIKHVTGTDEAAGRHCLSGLQPHPLDSGCPVLASERERAGIDQ